MVLNKGQMTVIAIIMVFLALVVFAAIYPAMSSVIGNLTETIGTDDPTTAWLIRLTPMFIVIAIIASFWVYISTRREYAE